MPEQSSTTSFVPGRCGVVGLGLMGGSFARAFRAAGREVFAWNRTRSTLELAEIETVTGELTDDVIGTCELIILAGYPQSAIDWLREKADLIADGAIVIDTVGVKRVICETCDKISEGHGWTFVGCHPMAGTQYSGFAHSRATMFKGAPMVVVPPKMADLERADLLERLKELLAPCQFGSFTLATAGVHDHVIAFTSQLAHVVSNAYVKSPTAREHHGFSAGSYPRGAAERDNVDRALPRQRRQPLGGAGLHHRQPAAVQGRHRREGRPEAQGASRRGRPHQEGGRGQVSAPKTQVVHVSCPSMDYDVHVGAGILSEVGAITRESCGVGRCCVISETNVAPLYLERVSQSLAEAGSSRAWPSAASLETTAWWPSAAA